MERYREEFRGKDTEMKILKGVAKVYAARLRLSNDYEDEIFSAAMAGYAKALNQYDPDKTTSGFRKYAFFLIRYEILNCYKSRVRKHAERTSRDVDVYADRFTTQYPEHLRTSHDVDEKMIQLEKLKAIQDLINDLPEDERVIMRMKHVEDMSFRAIAEKINYKSSSALQHHYYKIIAKLKKRMLGKYTDIFRESVVQ